MPTGLGANLTTAHDQSPSIRKLSARELGREPSCLNLAPGLAKIPFMMGDVGCGNDGQRQEDDEGADMHLARLC